MIDDHLSGVNGNCITCGNGIGTGLSCGNGVAAGLNCGNGMTASLNCGNGMAASLNCGNGMATSLNCGNGTASVATNGETSNGTSYTHVSHEHPSVMQEHGAGEANDATQVRLYLCLVSGI